MAMTNISLTSGMRANLVSLQNTNNLLEITQKRLSSGKKVNSALDDPVAYFTSVAHEQRASDLAGRKDQMSEAVQTVKAADAGIQSINTLIAAAKSLATAALATSGTGLDTLNTQYGTIRTQIDQMAADSGYKGVNLLGASTAALTVKFDETGDSALNIGGFNAATTSADSGLNLSVTTWVNGSGAAATVNSTNVEAAITSLDNATTKLRTESSRLANNLSIITARQEFTQGMINVLKDGAAGLTNADMNEEGANMLMLQTRQALGTTSLSLASQAAQAVLRLF